MEDIYLLIYAIVLLALQVLFFFVKKVWVRLIPTLAVAVLMGLCFLMYAVSRFANWGYLILLILLLVLMLVMGIAWLIFGVLRFIRNSKK